MINLSKKEKYPVVFPKNNHNHKSASYFCIKRWKRYEEIGFYWLAGIVFHGGRSSEYE